MCLRDRSNTVRGNRSPKGLDPEQIRKFHESPLCQPLLPSCAPGSQKDNFSVYSILKGGYNIIQMSYCEW